MDAALAAANQWSVSTYDSAPSEINQWERGWCWDAGLKMIQVYLEQLLLDHVLALTAPELIIITGSYSASKNLFMQN